MEQVYELHRDSNTNICEVFKSVKTLFGKKKLKKISFGEYYAFGRNKLIESKGECYQIAPSLNGDTLLNYLANKAKYNNDNFVSDFGFRTEWRCELQQEAVVEIDGEQVRDFLFNFSVMDPSGHQLIKSVDFHFSSSALVDVESTRRYVELLYQNACNGIYQTARDLEEFHTLSWLMHFGKTIEDSDVVIYICEECGKKFKTLNEFFYHLIEEGHQDSILTSHPFDKEVLRVKKLVEAKREEKNS